MQPRGRFARGAVCFSLANLTFFGILDHNQWGIPRQENQDFGSLECTLKPQINLGIRIREVDKRLGCQMASEKLVANRQHMADTLPTRKS